MIFRLSFCAILAAFGGVSPRSSAGPADTPRVDHCIVIAVDGLRSDALMVSPRDLPAFRRLMEEGAFTLNARTDPDITVTLPNHLGMVTGRLMLGDAGHHWERNDLDDESLPMVLHDARGQYIQSMFDVAHDHGLTVSIIAGKTKLHLLNNSWGEERGLEDVIGDDDGRTKIDTYIFDEAIGAVATKIIETLANSPSLEGRREGGGSGSERHEGTDFGELSRTEAPSQRSAEAGHEGNPLPSPSGRGAGGEGAPEMEEGAANSQQPKANSQSPRHVIFASYRHTDAIGHESGWDLTKDSPYMQTLREVDREIGRILDAIDSDDSLRGRVAIILTADHGGGAPHLSHTERHMWVNYIIPFIVWRGGTGLQTRDSLSLQGRRVAEEMRGSGGGLDLYQLNADTRRDPGLAQPPHDLPEGELPPIRNSDAANLALHLLGLPPVKGSTVNEKQELRISDE